MARGVPVQPEQRARAIELIRSGMGRNAIAREVGISTAAVSRIAADEGLTFENQDTLVATAIGTAERRVSRAARRGAIIERLYDRAEAILDRLEADEFDTLGTAEYGATREMTLTFVPTADERALSSSLNTYLERAARLELVDDGDGVAEADSMLGRLAKRFGLVD